MPRRGAPGVQVLVAVGILLVFVYGYYTYNELVLTLRKNDNAVKRMSLNEENLMTQLQVLNEQRNQLEQSIKADKDKSKTEKADLLKAQFNLESKCKQEKDKLSGDIESISVELSKLKADQESLQALREKFEASQTENARLENEIRRIQQESNNEVAVFRDQVADLKRKNDALRELIKRKTSGSSKAENGDKKAKNSVGGNHLEQENSLQQQQQQQWNDDDNHIPQLAGNGNAQNVGNREEKIEDRMQIRGPDEDKKLAYFEPKSAKPDHTVDVVQPAAVNDNSSDKNQMKFPEQVVPPNVEKADRLQHQQQPQPRQPQFQENVVRDPVPERFRRGAKVRGNSVVNNNNIPVRQVDANLAVAAAPAAMPFDGGRQRLEAGLGVKDSIGAKQWGVLREHANGVGGQVEKPLGIAAPHLNREEDQLQGPAAPNDREGDDRDEGQDNAEENDEDYQYEEKKAQKKNAAIDGPHAAPVEENDLAEGGLR